MYTIVVHNKETADTHQVSCDAPSTLEFLIGLFEGEGFETGVFKRTTTEHLIKSTDQIEWEA